MALTTLLGGCGTEEQPLQFRKWPIIGGTLDINTAHNGVVSIQENSTLCTGTLISPRVVMTAAHCMTNTDLTAYVVYFGNDVSTTLDPSLKRNISEFRIADGYNDNVIGVKDIALLRLSSDPPNGVTSIPNLPQRLEITQSDVNSPLVYIGYGKTTGVDGALDYGIKRTMTHNINWVCINVPGDCNELGSLATPNTICENQEITGICLGDSGGPALIERNGRTYVAGVSSFVGQKCQNIGCSTKVDAYESFISAFAQNGLGASCSLPYDCNSGFCVDSLCCDSTCDGPCMTCRPGGKCQAVPDGTSCSDNLLCNGDEVCKTGTCTPGVPLDCDDGNPCTLDSCDQSHGCIHTPLPQGATCGDCTGGQCAKAISGNHLTGGCSHAGGIPTSLDFFAILSSFMGIMLLLRRTLRRFMKRERLQMSRQLIDMFSNIWPF